LARPRNRFAGRERSATVDRRTYLTALGASTVSPPATNGDGDGRRGPTAPTRTVTRQGRSVTLAGVETATRLGETDAGDDAAFVVVDLVTANGGDAEWTVSAPLQTAVTDGDGERYCLHLAGTRALENAHKESVVSPGDSHRGRLAYRVPVGRRPLFWTVEFAPVVSDAVVTWRLR
jgi:hypothetical protein